MTKILVIGGGPAGYVAAGRAAQRGAEVTLVEAREIGGTCLNRGCIPTKAMVAGAARLHDARGAGEYGLQVGDVGLDFGAFMARNDAVTTQLRDGVAHLLKARKVQVVAGRAALAGPGRLALAPGAILPDGAVLEEGGELEGDAVILATGSEPVRMGLFDWSDPRMMTSDELLRIESVPETLAIVGGGVIGCEFASVFNRLGSEVTVIEMLDQLLPGEDKRAGRALQQAFKKAGIAVLLGTPVTDVEAAIGGVTLTIGDVTVTADLVLVAIGRRPVSRQRKAEHLVRKSLEIHARERGLRAFVFGVTDAALQTFRQCAVQCVWVLDLSLDIGVASQAALFHFFAAPRRRMASRAASADFGVRGHAANLQAVPPHGVEGPRIEHHTAGGQGCSGEQDRGDDARDDA